MRFTGICLITNNVRRLGDFYKDLFLIEADEEDENFIKFRPGGAEFIIFSHEGMENMAPNSMKNAGCGGFAIEFEVDDVDQEFERLKEMQVTIVKPPTTQVWGIRSVWIRDPDGNIVNLYANVK